MASARRVLVTGATGYIGSRLIPELLAAGWAVRVLTRDRSRISRRAWAEAVEVATGDASDSNAVANACTDVDVAYYLLHSMDGQGDFVARDRALAQTFATAASEAGLSRIVYLSGLHPDTDHLSPHLASRVEVGHILLDGAVPIAVLQAAVIVGSGSASFEMLRHLTRRLPAMVAPKWLKNRIQPIAIWDVLHYLVTAADLPASVNRTFDIGGPDVLTYHDMINRFADADGRTRPLVVTVPVLTPYLASHWVGLVTPVPTGVAKPLVGSLVHEVVCHEDDIAAYSTRPCADLLGIDDAIAAALAGPRRGAPDLPEPGTVDPAWLTAADPPWAG